MGDARCDASITDGLSAVHVALAAGAATLHSERRLLR